MQVRAEHVRVRDAHEIQIAQLTKQAAEAEANEAETTKAMQEMQEESLHWHGRSPHILPVFRFSWENDLGYSVPLRDSQSGGMLYYFRIYGRARPGTC